MPAMVQVTWMAFVEECLDGNVKDQAVKHGPWALRIPSKSVFGRDKQQRLRPAIQMYRFQLKL